MITMDRTEASQYCRAKLNEYGLKDWSVRLTTDPNLPFIGKCMYHDRCIILNAHYIDIHPADEVRDTILHEVAHALCPGQGHNSIWATKARDIGCTNTLACSHLDLPAHIIDAIRSGHTVEIEVVEKKVEHIIREVKHTVTRLQDYCPFCMKNGKKVVAKEVFTKEYTEANGDKVKLITLECFHVITRVIPRGTPFETMVSNDWKPEIKNCKHNWNKTQCLECGEFKLFNFQVESARFVESALSIGKGCLVAHEMGLGKTVIALSILKFMKKDKYKTMVVTKSAIKFQWFKEAIRFLGPDFLAQIISTSRDFLMPNLKLYIIPYDLLRRFPREKLYKLGINLVILDEVQQIKNTDSSRTQEVRKLVSSNPECKLIELSGTPWKNRGGEFFPALNLIDPIKFYSYQNYLDTWVEYYWDGITRKMGGIRNIPRFKEYTKDLVTRFEYDEVMEEFPDVSRNKLPVQLDELEQSTYDDATSDFVKWYNEKVIGGEEDNISGMEIIAKLQRMRHICGLAKIPATLSYLEEFVEESDSKIVVFVHHKDVGLLMGNALTNCEKNSNPDWYELAQSCKDAGIKILSYTSAHTGKPEGTDIQDTFNNTPRCIMIASTLACGEGLNLQTCYTAILHERQWNPQNEDQAAPGRFKRIGQKSKNIVIINPEAEGTTDEYLDNMVDRKRRYFHAVHNKGEVIQWNQDELMRELAQTIVAKFQAKMKASGKEHKPTNITAFAG